MNHLKRFSRSISIYIFLAVLFPGLFTLVSYYVLNQLVNLDAGISLIASFGLLLILTFLFYAIIKNAVLSPIEKIWQAVWHVSPNKSDMPAPILEKIKIGHEMVSSLVMQIYDLASNSFSGPIDSTANTTKTVNLPVIKIDEISESIPMPLLFLNKDRQVVAANSITFKYLNLPTEKVIGRSVNDVLRMSFMTPDTLESWLNKVNESSATASSSWEHIKLVREDNKIRQFDMAASFSKDKSSGLEVALAIFDRTETYDRQDQASGYVALAVHELRTPLTILRGYIEVFEDELGSSLTPELQEFMKKMSASAQSLTAFVSNILNVARVDENQFMLTLHKAEWGEVLTSIVKDLELRASVRGKKIELNIEPDLPAVAVDKVSMYEVVSNLIDNAIKYSGPTPKIVVSTKMGNDGNVETIVQDFGVGIPANAMEGLFTRYYRSHNSRQAVSGSGLGLYLVKSIVSAHGGNVWVNSKENEGSIFGFTIQTFENADASKSPTGSDKDGIERQASGWIKNHSLYRR